MLKGAALIVCYNQLAFCYLRILIVKTAIHQRFILIFFGLKLILMALGKIQHLYNIVIQQMPVFQVNSCGFRFCVTNLHWSCLLSNVRTQFAEFLTQYYLYALVFSTYEPVSVQGTVINAQFSRTNINWLFCILLIRLQHQS